MLIKRFTNLIKLPIYQGYFFQFNFSNMVDKLRISHNDFESAFKSYNLSYKFYEHEKCMTVEDMLQKIKLEHAPIIKTLFYEDKKGFTYLVLARHDTKVEKHFWKKLGLNYNNLRMAKEETLKNILNVEKGCVTPFALVNDHEKKVKHLILDNKLLKEEYVAFHPLINTAIVELKTSNFLNFLTQIQREYIGADLDQLEEKIEVVEKPVQQEENKGETKLKIEAKKEEAFSDWYSEVLVKGELIEYYDISGCYIIRPWAYGLWEKIMEKFDTDIKKNGVENAYFPLFVSQKALETEKDHVAGFSPEVAWVTRYSKNELKEPVAIRPTSETIMYPSYSKWINSHRDLPLKLNQWTNVVRWEFKHPTPFIRTREFLWQEGHTAHATKEEADDQTFHILELYKQVYEDLLAVPVIKGIKTETEKFAGGFYTTTVETFIPANGRGIQAATSHQLGQNFSKMFDIQYLDKTGNKQYAWQTSWGLSTRSLGVIVMTHGDNKGLVLPPRAALVQVIIVPIIFKGDDQDVLLKKCHELADQLKNHNIRVKVDDRDIYSPGWKYNHWELKGVPIRLEVGPKDLKNKEVKLVKRNDGEKFQVTWDNLNNTVKETLDKIHHEMLKKARDAYNAKLKKADNWNDFIHLVNDTNLVLTPWCKENACEENVKERSGIESKKLAEHELKVQLSGAAKSMCMPLEQEPIKEGEKCFLCGKPAQTRVIWGRSY